MNPQNVIKTNHIYTADCLEILKTFPDESIGLILTSPPYNLRRSSSSCMKTGFVNDTGFWSKAKLYGGYADGYSDDLPHEEYVRWQRKILAECLRVLRPDGAIFYNHKRRCQHFLEQNRNDILEGFPVRQTLIWDRCSSINFSRYFFLPSYEDIYIIAKSKAFKLKPKACHATAVWRIPAERNNPHPAPFPLEIPLRCIRSSEFTGPVLDPFCGSGTTLLAAEQLGVPWVGIDRSAEYTKMALDRIEKWREGNNLATSLESCRDTRQGNS